MSAMKSQWSSTKVPNLVRHRSGVYYARFKQGKKQIWKSLKTDLSSLAKPRLKKLLDEESRKRLLAKEMEILYSMTMVQAASIRLRSAENNPSTKSRTKEYWKEVHQSLEKSWAGFATLDAAKITQEDCEQWAGRYSKQISASRYNSALGALKQIFEIAIEHGVRQRNPAAKLKRLQQKSKDLTLKLPNKEQFRAWVGEIRNGHGRFSKDCADFVGFLAYSGLRVGEAKWVLWRNCDFKRGEIIVIGEPIEGPKNGETRNVPIISSLQDLLEKMQQSRPNEASTDVVLKVNEAQKAMDRAAKIVGHTTRQKLRGEKAI